jgi:mono/diheme cytochrome c family protein
MAEPAAAAPPPGQAPRRPARWPLYIMAAVVIAGAAAAGALPAARAYWRSRESNPLTRGRLIAERKGCFACHGPEGTAGIPNPGAKGDQVPAWDGGTAMMYVDTPGEIREYIADGLPARKRADQAYVAATLRAKIAMPAYRELLSEKDLDDLAAYVVAVSGLGGPPEDSIEAKGRAEAREHGCFSCHGVDGAGLVPNPGSLKGYIPGWRGPDFAELVRDDGELRAWILDGGIPRFAEDRLARFFIDAQKTQMPAYRGAIKDEDVAAIMAYIKWLRAKRS